jgi:eukaryotic-like serine/threonine-protein kinase
VGDATSGIPRTGDWIAGKYQVEQVLGAGGMGVVVAARHAALRQQVAVKFLLPAATRFPDATARFLREAQAAAAIRSEHVARVLDVGTLESGAPYMVMELLTGTDLRRLLQQRGPLPVTEAVDFVLQAGEAIAEAHTLGIVHRDLKPANIFLTHRADGSPLVKVLDFGLSKTPAEEAAGDRSLTATDVVAGSPEYMSPEQVRSLKNVDGRTDIWALGVALYELLTGQRPFTGPTAAAVCASVAADTPAPARALRRDIPEGLDRVLGACLEKDPNRRIATMGELAAALAPFAGARSAASIERVGRLSPMTAGRGSLSEVGPLAGAPLPSIALSPGNGVAPVAYAPPPVIGLHDPIDGTVTLLRAQPSATGAATAATGLAASTGAAPLPGLPTAGALTSGNPLTAAPTSSTRDHGTHAATAVRTRAAMTAARDTGALGSSGHTDGWGQTRRSRAPSGKGPVAAVVGALSAAAITIGILAWQLTGTSENTISESAATMPGSAAGSTSETGLSTASPPAVSPAAPLPASTSAPATASGAPGTTATASPGQPPGAAPSLPLSPTAEPKPQSEPAVRKPSAVRPKNPQLSADKPL